MKRKKVDIKCSMSDYAAIIKYKIGKKNFSNKKIIHSKKYLIDKLETEVTGIEFQSLLYVKKKNIMKLLVFDIA